MKSKLPCCEINKNDPSDSSTLSPLKTLECDHCECVFEKKKQLDGHIREIHEVQFTGKRKLACCKGSENKRLKNRHHECVYCECAFQKKLLLNNHMNTVHQCSKCCQISLEIRAQQQIKHNEEERKKLEAESKQKEKDDDLVIKYVLTNKLDEYQPDPDYEPDLRYIFGNYDQRMEIEQMLAFVRKFEPVGFLNEITGCYQDFFTSDEIVYLLENGGVSIEEVTEYLDNLIYSLGDDEIVPELVEYFMDKDYEIECEWVAKSIMIDGRTDDALMKRIEQKYKYTFDQVYGAREKQSLSHLMQERERFYVEVHKYFPDPNFKDPFADPFIGFERISTVHVHDHLQNRYFYDEEDDKLSIVVGYGDEQREISLGGCKEMLKMNLQDLVEQYKRATAVYDKANDTVDDLFEKRGEELDAASTEEEREDILDHYYYEIYKDGALSERNHIANEVSKLYFVIAQK